MLCFAAAVESLRIANRMANRKLYDWTIIGEGGEEITCSAGVSFRLDSDLIEMNREKFLFAVQEAPMFAVELLASIDERLRDIKLADN